MKDDDDLIFQDEEGVTTTEGISPEAPAEEEKSSQPRDEAGKFVAADKGETAPVEPTGAPPAPKPEPGHIPITALLEEREKRQRYEAEIAEYRRRLDDIQRQQQAPKIPDVIEDQQGFANYMMQQQSQMRDNLEAQFSERFARKEYGSEAVDAALAAARQTGAVQHFTSGPDRWERMCEWHKQQLAAAEIGGDPAAYRTRLEAEIRAQIMAEMGSPKPVTSPPKSLASAAGTGVASPSAGGDPLFD